VTNAIAPMFSATIPAANPTSTAPVGTRVHNERNRGLWRHRLPEAFARLASPLL